MDNVDLFLGISTILLDRGMTIYLSAEVSKGS